MEKQAAQADYSEALRKLSAFSGKRHKRPIFAGLEDRLQQRTRQQPKAQANSFYV